MEPARVPRRARALLGALGVVAVLGACVASPEAVDPAGLASASVPLVVASDLDNPPFAFVDGRGAAAGRDVEMMERLAARLGRPLRWKRVPFDALLATLESGAADVVCATLGVTAERAERVRFTRPYFETALAVVARAGAGEPRTLRALAGRRVAAAAGTTSERAVRRRLLHAVGDFEAKAGATTAERLRAGEIDAAVMDGPAADALVAASGGALVRLAEDLGAERYALAVARAKAGLAERLDAALAELERAGALAELDRAHGLAPRR